MKPLRVLLFFNNLRGVNVLKFLLKKKDICVENIYLSRKNLNAGIIKGFKKKKILYQIIKKQDLNNIANTIKKKKILI